MSPRTPADRRLSLVLRRERDRLGLTQEQVAHAAGMTLNGLQRVEYSQSSPSFVTVLAITRALRLSLRDLADAYEEEA